MTSDGTCVHCRAGRATQCIDRALFGYSGAYPRLDGGQADFVRVPQANRTLFTVPESVSNEDAIFVADVLPTGFAGVLRSRLPLGGLLVVLGCGPIGLMSVLTAVGTARRVIAVDGIAERRTLARELGAPAVSPADASPAVGDLSNGLGADAAIEASGSVAALHSAFQLPRPHRMLSPS